MSKFILISDTHLGANPMFYQQQKGYPEHLDLIVKALKEFITEQGDIDFVLHAGDMIDFTSDQNIDKASRVFDFSIPLYLCLGNHDLTTPDSREKWLNLAPQFFLSGNSDFTIIRDDCAVHIAPNQWCETPYFWDDSQEPFFLNEQKKSLKTQFLNTSGRHNIFVTHCPVYGLPKEQTGKDVEIHAPAQKFTQECLTILKNCGDLKCVISGHTHLNMRREKNSIHYVTASSLSEVPFEFKCFEIDHDKLTMQTYSLENYIDMKFEYNPDRAFVQGRRLDRTF